MADYDVAVIGGGPGGYVAAIRAAQLGLNVVLFEGDRVGGLCLNWGCIPSKAVLKNADVVNLVKRAEEWGIHAENVTYDLASAIDRSREVVEKIVGGVEGLLEANGITTVPERASFVDEKTLKAGDKTYTVDNVIIATGASTRMVPGIDVDGEVVITSREALAKRDLPGRAVVIGGGAVGVEFAHVWASYGSEVTVVEMMPTLVPNEDTDVGKALERSMNGRGIKVLTGTKVESVSTSGGRATVKVSKGDDSQDLEADVVLVAIGFVPHTEGLDLDKAGVKTDRGFVVIDDQMQTNVPGIYAVGDVTGKLMLAHVASQQGTSAAEAIAGKPAPALDYVQMPRATFCQPQIGSIGFTEKQAKEAGYTTKSARFPFSALGKSVAVGETEGFIKIVADEKTGQVLGIHMIGHDVNDLLGGATLASILEATTVEIGFAVHAHPTLSEALKEAALAVDGEAIHIARRRPSAAQPKQGAQS